MSAPASTLARKATLPLPPGSRPSERGAPPPFGTAHSSSERFGCTDTGTIGRVTRVAPSPLMLATIERRRLLVPLPWMLATAVASVAQYLPRPLITVDQVRQLRTDNVVSEIAARESRTLAGLGIQATSLEAMLESYLYRFRPHGQFDRPRPA